MKIKLDESRVLEFKIDTSSGVALKDLQGYLRFNIAGIEYGFPAIIENDLFKVEVPAFQNVVNSKLTESISKNKELIVKGRLDVIANKNAYVVPWQGDIDIEIPISMNVSEGGTLDESHASKKKITVSDPEKVDLLDAFNDIFKKENIEKKVEESKLKDILKVEVKEKVEEEDKKWAYGTKDKKWHLIGKDDRDYGSAISQKEFKKLGKEKAKEKYLGSSVKEEEKTSTKSRFAQSLEGE